MPLLFFYEVKKFIYRGLRGAIRGCGLAKGQRDARVTRYEFYARVAI